MGGSQLRTAVLGAGSRTGLALILDLQPDPRCQIVTICGMGREPAQDSADPLDIPEWASDWHGVRCRPDIDVLKPSHARLELDGAALEVGKHLER